MPSTRLQHALTLLPTLAPWRRMFPDRTVRRTVQGVPLYLPWSHPLPDYARSCPTYGQNLVELAVALHANDAGDQPLTVLDVGANIGDSAAQILARTDAEVLCVEGDPYWEQYLDRNLGNDKRVTLVAALLTEDEAPIDATTAVRASGTTHFVSGGAATSARTMSVARLRRENEGFDAVRLVKSDTDGFDTTLVSAIVREWTAAPPVIFFEFDPVLTRSVSGADPYAVWDALAEAGYSHAVIWDNGGDPLGQLDLESAARHARELEPRPTHLGYYFWDVAVCRADDTAARAAFDAVVAEPFDPRGVQVPAPSIGSRLRGVLGKRGAA